MVFASTSTIHVKPSAFQVQSAVLSSRRITRELSYYLHLSQKQSRQSRGRIVRDWLLANIQGSHA
jgi:hypothetical protein